MKLNVNKLLLSLLFVTQIGVAQRNNNIKIDGVQAVVGNEIILQSDIDRDFEVAKQSGQTYPDKCSFVNNMLIQKMVLNQAKNDTLVNISEDRIKARASSVLEDFRSRANDEQLFKMYGVKTIPELQNEIETLVRDNALIEGKRGLIEELSLIHI